jgi:NAD(P)-dependent dehydrogenase (short-subunit alcohol dehydrogenase family)
MSGTLSSAVVTGAASGLGRALAVELARRGASVIAADIDETGAARTVAEIERGGGRAWAHVCDVSDPDAVHELAARARERVGDVDFLANNAGVAVGGRFETISLDDWRWIVDINLWGVIHGCQAFLPAMQARGAGYIVNVASMAGLMAGPELSPYNVTKSGVVALSESLYAENRRSGVHVSVLCPSFFQTRIMDNARGVDDEEQRALVARFMERSRVQAPQVAAVAIDAVLGGALYALPMRDGRVLWRLKRLLGARFYSLVMDPLARMVAGRNNSK